MICKTHPKYRGLRRPTTKKDCICHAYWADFKANVVAIRDRARKARGAK
jgi:hypothetical protein